MSRSTALHNCASKKNKCSNINKKRNFKSVFKKLFKFILETTKSTFYLFFETTETEKRINDIKYQYPFNRHLF